MPPDFDTLHAGHLDALESAYAATLARHDLDGVLLYSGHPHYHFADDQAASFATYAHLLHWVPMPGLAHCWLLIRPGERPRLYFHAPDDFWHRPARLPDEAWVDRFVIEKGRFEQPPTLPAGRYAILGEVAPEIAASLGAALNPPRLTAELDEGRVRKSDYEVACLRDANRQAMAGHRAARDAFLDGHAAELDIQLAYLAASRQRESEVPYGNIVGLNAHGGVLHYQHYDTAPPARRHSLLVDAGHRHRGYCADITRSWAGPDAEPLFATLIAGMTALKDRLVASLAPGVSFVALHQRMHRELAALLVEHGLVGCSAEAAVENGITRAFCPHGLGHLLGLQVHDVAGRSAADGTPLPPPEADPALRLTRELEAGMVVTIEPGCYVIPMLLAPLRESSVAADIDWAKVERLASHGGIRIEDNVRITRHGADNLTPEP
ncbi:Xaa-Pro dipeptidase [Halomonas sp. NO4]|uniref:Xaa-Pro dipeptidase n=1 Tax=Halomonas sp. NO4 TaxID=2484813 RepID=UPI0013D24A62|nr:Xaa-Pro dipeptidase [Halomonas sp. NO4]